MSFTISKSQLPLPEAEFRSALEQYQADLVLHSFTEGVPAPFPAFELFRLIVASGGELIVHDDLTPEINRRNAIASADRKNSLARKGFVTQRER